MMVALLKRRLRGAADQAARLSGLLARRELGAAGALTVLTYHRVLPAERCAGYPFPALAMPVDAFRAQVRWLAAQRETLPLGPALERVRAGGAGGRPLCALTFDDGYHDAAVAAGILEESGLRGTFFVTTGFVASGQPLWFDAAARLLGALPDAARRALVLEACGAPAPELPGPRSPPAAWVATLKRVGARRRAGVLAALESAAGGSPAAEDDRPLDVAHLVALRRAGHEIGSHSVSHEILTDLDDAELAREVEGAQRALRGWLGAEVAGFCYPNGDHDPRVTAAVARARHGYACTTRAGSFRAGDDGFRVPRVDVVAERLLSATDGFSALAFRRELCGLYRRRAPVNGRS
jgi:peptidoglycan/xylan/chitin deacetylase (PgdA/CDA1 family)